MNSSTNNVFVNQSDRSVRVHLDAMDEARITKIATDKHRRWSSTTDTSYRINNMHSKLVGVAGEISVHRLMEKFAEIAKERHNRIINIDPIYLDEKREGACDILVNGVRCEVKTLVWRDWVQFGPCIVAEQRRRIEQKADIIIWVVHNKSRRSSSIMGFTPVDEIASVPATYTGVPEHRIFNHVMRYNVYELTTDLFFDYFGYMKNDHRNAKPIHVPTPDEVKGFDTMWNNYVQFYKNNTDPSMA